ncbi:MAG: VOC family protein [Candidatus Micrarchaeota archaeon]|nr:VOC family protein [Candidatus Micrarchaeota archaeon]MDE1848163.1 VOC family protein [Candidatus Micrarchaeota archaeon]MDE1864649.1 VOC family protein [Candidatus Micrarchaeota archaeon]
MDGVVHFEIPAMNVKRAKDFYTSIFGWNAEDYPQMNYTLFHTGEVDKKTRMLKKPGMINGGMMKRNSKIKSPVVYMYVKSISATLNKIKKQGGKVVTGKTHVSGNMYTAYFKDSEGNIMGLAQGMM